MEKIKELLKDKKKRYLITIVCVLPFIIAIAIFGILVLKDIKSLKGLATNNQPTETEKKYYIESLDYLVRDNATNYQAELFQELRDIVTDKSASDADIAAVVVKNYVADFYTWTNKAGQYDVGGMYFVSSYYDDEIYIQARDGMYKHINEYINKYGSKELLEVDHVEAVGKPLDGYTVNGEVEDEAYEVNASWSYVQGKKFDTSKFATKMNFVVIVANGHLEIVEATSEPISTLLESLKED